MSLSYIFDTAYMLATEELPFSKYPSIIEMEKLHGVNVGNTYNTEHMYISAKNSHDSNPWTLCLLATIIIVYKPT